jgi:hypothetical protein
LIYIYQNIGTIFSNAFPVVIPKGQERRRVLLDVNTVDEHTIIR